MDFELGDKPIIEDKIDSEIAEVKKVENGVELVSLEDLKPKNFISLKDGATVELTIKKINKVAVPSTDKYKLSKTDYRFEIITDEDKILNVIAWDLWGKVRKVLTNAGKITGVKLKISHPGVGDYTVEEIK